MSLSIISWNVNGLRAVDKKKELHSFINEYNPDIFCLQETKCRKVQVSSIIDTFSQYDQFYVEAEKAGYSGTSIWIKKKSLENYIYTKGMDDFYLDTEGRIARVDFTYEQTPFSLITVYFPNGGKSPEAWKEKLIFYKKFLEYIQFLEKEGKTVIFCGDVNTCHTAIDIARPKANDGKIGFHPEERACLDEWISAGFKDLWREKNHNQTNQYSWWSYRGGARTRNVGWRIDYFFAPESIVNTLKNIRYLNSQNGSDHCPIELVI